MLSNPPAFPRAFSDRPIGKDETTFFEAQEGMTLRDYFAAKAMQGALCNHGKELITDVATTNSFMHLEALAGISYKIADAMLATREREGK